MEFTQQLTPLERLMLLNQFTILEKLNPDEPNYRESKEIVQNGYVGEYSRLMLLLPPEFSEAQSREVNEILEMFQSLADAHQAFGDKSGVKPQYVQFIGFDGNNELEYLSYVRFLKSTDRWAITASDDHLNSHSPMLPLYRAMLDRWAKSVNRTHLTEAELLFIVEPRAFGIARAFTGDMQ